MMFWLKACPKCGGDLQRIEALLETYVECVQCGLELTPVQEKTLRRRGHVAAAVPVPAPVLTHEGRHHTAA
ncbi:MAG: hypothetical protein IIC31_09645 [Chloroflexi bacterium]|nr:hypothetical protein [Chloroflexota bacterium]